MTQNWRNIHRDVRILEQFIKCLQHIFLSFFWDTWFKPNFENRLFWMVHFHHLMNKHWSCNTNWDHINADMDHWAISLKVSLPNWRVKKFRIVNHTNINIGFSILPHFILSRNIFDTLIKLTRHFFDCFEFLWLFELLWFYSIISMLLIFIIKYCPIFNLWLTKKLQ